MSSTIVNLSADPTDPNAGMLSGSNAYNPVEVLLGPGTYTIGNIGIADGGLYDSYSVYAPSPGNNAFTDGQWGFSFSDGDATVQQMQTDETRFDSSGQALAAFKADAPLTFTLTQPTTVSLFLNDKAYPFFADDAGGVSLAIKQVAAAPLAPVPSTIVNLSADPTAANAGTTSGFYNYNPVQVVLGPGTYSVANIGIADGGKYDAYTVYAPTSGNAAYTDGQWGLSFSDGNASVQENENDVTRYNSASDALAHFKSDAPLTFTLTGTTTVSFYINDSAFPYFIDDSGGVSLAITQVSAPACFLAGTRILTATGEVAVEELAVGDLVSVRAADGSLSEQPVAWIGHRAIRAALMPEPDRYPVRVHAHAFGPDAPCRDLLITPEHCLLVDGVLVPARMLVNGRSIVIDRSFADYTVYHLELPRHGILIADGLTAESYLDTGNRGNFANADAVALNPDFTHDASHARWADAAAPLATDRATVEPIWRALALRAEEAGLTQVQPERAPAGAAALRLTTDLGQVILPTAVTGDRVLFSVPGGAKTLRLRSRTARPSDVIGPFVDDRRALGVAVGEIIAGSGGALVGIDSHLTDASLEGWHAPEGQTRWTNGNAILPVAVPEAANETLLVSVQVLAAGPTLERGLPLVETESLAA